MYGFGMIVLLGLAAVGVGAVAYRYLAVAREFWALLIVLLGIGAAWLANFDLFAVWGLAVRDHAIAVTFTGFAIAGAGYFWRVILQFLAEISRKFTDEARSLEKTERDAAQGRMTADHRVMAVLGVRPSRCRPCPAPEGGGLPPRTSGSTRSPRDRPSPAPS